MAVKMRLRRKGRKKTPFYHIVVADSQATTDGRFIEKLGVYNPMTTPVIIELDRERAFNWLLEGAQPTDTVQAILRFKGVLYQKHLMLGVAKGSISQEEANQKLESWIKQKEARISVNATPKINENVFNDATSKFIPDIPETKPQEKIEKLEEDLISGKIIEAIEKEENQALSIGQDSYIRIVLNGNAEEFSFEKQKRFLEYLQKLLGNNEDIAISSIRKGSVIVEIKLNKKNAMLLMKLLTTGEFDKNEFDIQSAELLNFRKVKKGNKSVESKIFPLPMWKQKIKDKIAADDLKNVFTEFESSISPNESIYDEAVHLKARYNQKINSSQQGIIDKEYFDQEMNVIRIGMLNIVNKLNEKHLKPKFEV